MNKTAIKKIAEETLGTFNFTVKIEDNNYCAQNCGWLVRDKNNNLRCTLFNVDLNYTRSSPTQGILTENCRKAIESIKAGN